MARFPRDPGGKRAGGWAESRHDRHRWPPAAGDAVSEQPEAALSVAAVARRLGIAPATLRTWDRRYGLGPSEHSAGAHRRYSPDDLARLLTMRRLTLEGVAPGEAARTALSTPRQEAAPSELDVLDAYADAEMPPDPDALVAAARHGDNAAVRWMLARVHPRDPLEWYATLVRPAMSTLAAEPVLERAGESSCHRLEASCYAELRSRSVALATRTAEDVPAAPVALVAPTGAATDLEAHVLAGALSGRGVPASVLVGGTPETAAEAVARARAQVLVVHAGHRGTPDAVDLVRRLDGADDLMVFWHEEGRGPVPDGLRVHRVRSLAGACYEVAAVLS
ncbi:MerR family transcriptional regulator [Isoptericola sp. b490]|uniref:MerR family transcriptional regulator n=1 Tax=Actinotalea lenta TaxID=3064654 RepID=UPI002713634F|nr:MerR family transcriptional regulator [Isoptericola sp. b490]MDO8122369.1 MerR family transcriptional regulator [Isoptericola sp. b490]